jgi:hypothetical protein
MTRSWRFAVPVALVVIGGLVVVERQVEGQGQPNRPEVTIAGPLPLPVTGTITGTANVNVTNSPLPVRDVDSAWEPVQFETSCSNDQLVCNGVDAYTVPAGKLLVIEYAAVQAAPLPPGEAAFMDISTVVGGSSVLFAVPPPPLVLGGRSFQGQTVRLYANPSTNVTLRARRLSGASGAPVTSYLLSFAGRLVPAP